MLLGCARVELSCGAGMVAKSSKGKRCKDLDQPKTLSWARDDTRHEENNLCMSVRRVRHPFGVPLNSS